MFVDTRRGRLLGWWKALQERRARLADGIVEAIAVEEQRSGEKEKSGEVGREKSVEMELSG
jgi:hypothetical protein